MEQTSQPTTSTLYTCIENMLDALKFKFHHVVFYRLKRYFPRVTFLLLHWTYFITLCLVSSIIFWHFSTPHRNVSYVDSIFMVVAAMTQAGLNTVNLSSLNTFQQCLLLFHIICGNQIFVSAFVVLVRKQAFHSRFKKATKEKERSEKQDKVHPRGVRRNLGQTVYAVNTRTSLHPSMVGQPLHCAENLSHKYRLRVEPSLTSLTAKPAISEITQAQLINVGGHDDDMLNSSDATHDARSILRTLQHPENPHLEKPGTVDRNAQFHSLSFEEREHLGCVEYQAVRLLSYVVPAYLITWQLFGCIAIGAYMAGDERVATAANAINPWWAGAFYAVAGFNNAGMSLLDLSVIPFQKSVYVLLILGILMLAGNTAYPVFLRFILRAALHILPDKNRFKTWRETIEFILKYPRRVYTNLFASAQTWWLSFLLVIFNAIDWTAFEVLNRNNPVVKNLPVGYRLLDGLFQSLAVRSSGFAVVPIGSLAVGVQALYIMMMYISAFPVVITMRNSNVYEERSLGIYSQDIRKELQKDGSDSPNSVRRNRMYFVREQVQRQLGHDLWFVTVCMILIVWIETYSYERDPVTFSTFSIIFEVMSAYGCVGLSIGLPDQAYSFCGAWRAPGKLILCALMLRGRHRGLPVAIDKAIQLPGEKEGLIEEHDHEIREARSRQESRVSV